jgi:hypothetical protein
VYGINGFVLANHVVTWTIFTEEMIAHYEDTRSNTLFSQLINLKEKGSVTEHIENSQLKQKVLLELHTSPVGGRSGFLKTYHRVRKDFFWDGLKTNVQRFVEECLV